MSFSNCMMLADDDDDVQSKSMKRVNDDTCQRETLGLLSEGEDNDSSLNVDKLLTLFGGSHENLDYFLGLWKATRLNVTPAASDNHLPNCDPRDERKRSNIKDWRPRVLFCPVDRGVVGRYNDWDVNGDDIDDDGGVEVHTENYAVKQTVLDDGGDDLEGHWSNGKSNVMTVEQTEEGGATKRFPCGVHGCGQVLTSLANYESHYHHCHNYMCDTCRRVFVSSFLLDIHLQENHDSYFAILSNRIDMYRCLVDSCDLKFRTSNQRKDHLVSVHKFPSSFSFHQPIKSQSHRSENEKDSPFSNSDTISSSSSSASHLTEMESENKTLDEISMDMEPSCSVISTTSDEKEKNIQQRCKGKDGIRTQTAPKVPTSICFGRGSQRAFQPRRGRGRGNKAGNRFQNTSLGSGSDGSSSTINIESVDMRDLEEALH